MLTCINNYLFKGALETTSYPAIIEEDNRTDTHYSYYDSLEELKAFHCKRIIVMETAAYFNFIDSSLAHRYIQYRWFARTDSERDPGKS